MQEQPIVIRNMQGETIARLGEEQGCTDDREIFMKGIDYSYYYEQED